MVVARGKARRTSVAAWHKLMLAGSELGHWTNTGARVISDRQTAKGAARPFSPHTWGKHVRAFMCVCCWECLSI